jgi:hypothetical protein
MILCYKDITIFISPSIMALCIVCTILYIMYINSKNVVKANVKNKAKKIAALVLTKLGGFFLSL